MFFIRTCCCCAVHHDVSYSRILDPWIWHVHDEHAGRERDFFLWRVLLRIHDVPIAAGKQSDLAERESVMYVSASQPLNYDEESRVVWMDVDDVLRSIQTSYCSHERSSIDRSSNAERSQLLSSRRWFSSSSV